MGSKQLVQAIATVVIMVLFGVTKADINKDKAQCANQLVGLVTCLPYVGGEAKTPTTDCCSGLKEVVAKSKVCLCLLIKDHNDPSLNLKINETLALGLPDSCHMPTNISECISLLHLQPGSPDAKVFEDFGNLPNSKNTTIVLPGNATNANTMSSNGERRKTWWGLKVVAFFLIIVMLHFRVSNDVLNYLTVI